jgi:hypothetical protein
MIVQAIKAKISNRFCSQNSHLEAHFRVAREKPSSSLA